MNRNFRIPFLLVNALVLLVVFRGALWGSKLLAPLDIAAATYPKYRFVEPNSSGVASNYGLNDQFVYDLPIQYTIHAAYQRREVPWWDPYSYAGRPLLADAHINGTDPIRVIMDVLLPFELAYNWTRIIHFFLSGLGIFLLLEHWKIRWSVCVLLAVTAEFSGYNANFFGYPWLQGSLLYYPFVWRVWDAAARAPKWWHLPAGALLVAAIFYAGNLQSHTYLCLFATAFLFGYGKLSPRFWRSVAPTVVLSLCLGACLAAPVLFNEVELFVRAARAASPSANPRVWFIGLASLSSAFPWLLGAPGTLDLRNYFFRNVGLGQNYGLGFHTFIGSAGFFLALLGGFKGGSSMTPEARRTALGLVAIVLVILSSPLITIFYSRSAGLAVLGLVILAAQGCEFLASSQERMRGWGRAIAGLAVGIAVAVNVGGLLIYPRLARRVEAMVLARENSMNFKVGLQARKSQFENFPKEISFRNPAVVLAFLSLLTLAAMMLNPQLIRMRGSFEVLLALNFLPVFLLFGRLAPCHSTELWRRLLAGGPEQRRVMAALNPDHLRLQETAIGRNDPLFPDAMEHLYQVRTVHGYAALPPRCLYTLTPGEQQRVRQQLADYTYETGAGQDTGKLVRADIAASARFQWLGSSPRLIKLEEETLTRIRLSFSDGPAGALLWTDTYYPGWSAQVDNVSREWQFTPPSFSKIEIPENARSLVLRYQPTFFRVGMGIALFGLLTTCASAIVMKRGREPGARALTSKLQTPRTG